MPPAAPAAAASTSSPRALSVSSSSSVSSPATTKKASVSVAATAGTTTTTPAAAPSQLAPPASTTGSTSIKEALERFERSKGLSPSGVSSTAEKVELWGQCPPIEKMDASLGKLEACRHLSLSTNSIDRISGLYGLSKLQILSLGRNLLRSLAGVEVVAGTLEELWVSYNSLDKLAGAEKLPRLRVLLASNNKITSWAEVERLSSLPHLTHLLLAGNPLATEYRDRGAALEYRLEMLKRLPRLAKIDGLAVGAQEREAVARGGGANKSGGGASGSGGGVV